jgi:hypothetical protein
MDEQRPREFVLLSRSLLFMFVRCKLYVILPSDVGDASLLNGFGARKSGYT